MLKASLDYHSKWTYQLPFLLMFIIPVPLALGLYFAPESPYYLARKGRLEEAAVQMDRLHTSHPSIDPSLLPNSVSLVAHIKETFDIEARMKTGGSFAACFKGVNRRRLEIAVVSWTTPGLVGYVVQVRRPTSSCSRRTLISCSPLHLLTHLLARPSTSPPLHLLIASLLVTVSLPRPRCHVSDCRLPPFPSQFYATFFFTRAGLPTDKAFALGLGNYCLAFVSRCLSRLRRAG